MNLVVRVSTIGVFLGTAAVLSGDLHPGSAPPVTGPLPTLERQLTNLRAFAKVYGYVRFFHPSDEAAILDWSRFALHGAGRVRRSATSGELEETLEELFVPVAPTLDVYRSGREPDARREPAGSATPEAEIVAWQHVGVDLGVAGAPYRSYRLNRGGKEIIRRSWFEIRQRLDALPHRGKDVRLTASVRARVRGLGENSAHLMLQVRGDGRTLFNDWMRDRPILADEWRRYEVKGRVAESADTLVIAAVLFGEGALWLDDVELSVRPPDGEWQRVAVENAGFEAAEGEDGIAGWEVRGEDAEIGLTETGTSESRRAARIVWRRGELEEPLFDARPGLDETVDEALTDSLRVRVPLAVASRDGRTVPRPRANRLTELRAALARIDPATLAPEDPVVRAAGIVEAWTVLQHFFPYFEHADADWDRTLTWALTRALEDEDGAAFLRTLRLLTARLEDGHSQVAWLRASEEGHLPLLLERVGDEVVVTAAADTAIRPGDVVLSVDGTPVLEAAREAARYISGSPQLVRRAALREMATGPVGSTAELMVTGPEGRRSVSVTRAAQVGLAEPRPESFEELASGIVYVDLTRVPMSALRERMDELTAAEGIVFDVRGYPAGNHRILQHLLTRPDTADAWFLIPQIIYPDRRGPVGYEEHGWGLEPENPHIDAACAFITDSRAISYAEGLLAIVDHYRLGEIVGGRTAGANGNVNVLYLPGGYQVVFGGMKALHPDGSRFHNVGIAPTVPVARSVGGIRQGRDELLDAAVEVVEEALERGGE